MSCVNRARLCCVLMSDCVHRTAYEWVNPAQYGLVVITSSEGKNLPYGKLEDIFLPCDKYSGKPRGFGFVTFADGRDAQDACEAMNGWVVSLSHTRAHLHLAHECTTLLGSGCCDCAWADFAACVCALAVLLSLLLLLLVAARTLTAVRSV